jgi:hypothetical protein
VTLGKKQRLFTRLVGELIAHAYAEGYELTLAEAYRPPETAELYARQGRGIKDSLHELRLAIDFNLFRDGQFLAATEAHRPLGEWWETQHLLCRWGGRFQDGGHYSLTHGGRA